MPEREVVLLLGADLGDPVHQCDQAAASIHERLAPVLACSRDHWTAPWGFVSHTIFLNRALFLRTAMSPERILGECLAIEKDMGRIRSTTGGPASRIIDIDVLLIGTEVRRTDALQLPHPRLHLRRFALAPLCDLLPGWEHPLLGRTALQILDQTPLR
jgi:2-amino-4-hydroxy-6-hydroxymethyldihydropteridine diphosphokinase